MEKIGREYDLQTDFLNGEIEHSVINKRNLSDLRHIWEPYLKLNVLCLAFIYARLSMKMQNLSAFGIKYCLTEASLGWKRFAITVKIEKFTRLTINMLDISYVNQ